MKVISILQPWASLVVLGHKKIETRSWNTKYRGPLLIHASMGKKPEGRLVAQVANKLGIKKPAFDDLPFGAIIGQVELLDTLPSEYLLNKQFGLNIKGHEFMNRGISDQEKLLGDYSPKRYGWLLANAIEFSETISVGGGLGLWDFDMETKQKIVKAKSDL